MRVGFRAAMSIGGREKTVWVSGIRFIGAQAVLFVVISGVVRWLLWSSFAWHLRLRGADLISFYALGALGDATVAAWLFLPGVLWVSLLPGPWSRARWPRAMLLATTWLG